MNLAQVLAGLSGKKDDKPTETMDDPGFTSSRLLIMLAFVGLILYSTKGVLTEANVRLISQVVMVVIVCKTLSRLGCYAANAFIKGRAIRLAWADKKVTPEEAAVVAGATVPSAG